MLFCLFKTLCIFRKLLIFLCKLDIALLIYLRETEIISKSKLFFIVKNLHIFYKFTILIRNSVDHKIQVDWSFFKSEMLGYCNLFSFRIHEPFNCLLLKFAKPILKIAIGDRNIEYTKHLILLVIRMINFMASVIEKINFGPAIEHFLKLGFLLLSDPHLNSFK